ncbi:MAG: hypothetical protein RLP44_29945 [Aggregatilineales bacterium]
MTHKTTDNNMTDEMQVVTQQDFLRAFYAQSSSEHWLELRCIHPETGEVRTLWTQFNKPKQLETVLKQADKLNAESFGVFFAPCLRKAKQGSAASAILLPALWLDVDCDDDPHKRENGLAKLHGFNPAPSIILDSGGGWHSYWLLDEPFLLETDKDKQKTSQIMQGLFSVLSGDEGYVKSVASIMRLPSTINTKPERLNARVQIIEWHPERRYSLSNFEWLEVKPKPQNGYMSTFSTNGNGQHPLPPRTEQYLASGAVDGSRNAELFAAACQLRDAGHSQSDAERELVARHVADGNGSENPASREKEAKATIASAFKQPPREPIQSRRQVADAQVNRLVDRYDMRQKSVERPSTAEIIEAVEACALLNAVEWAEQREKFKALTGDGLRISDIDRLYKEKKREQQQAFRAELLDTEEYLEMNGHMVYRRHTHRGVNERVIANWTGRILERLSKLNDDNERSHFTVLEVHDERETVHLEVPSETFGDDIALRKFIAREAGESFAVRAGMTKHLASAILSLSGEYPIRKAYSYMGWLQEDNRWIYLTPHDCITAKGRLADKPLVELTDRLSDYGVNACEWDKALEAFSAMTKVFPEKHVSACITFTLLPLLQRFFPAAASKPALHLAGTYGSGKSELAALMCSFYGDFSRDAPPSQWGDTINTVEILGNPLSDALYWVDDFKSIYIDERIYTRFMQGYSRNMGRGRLTREAQLRKSRPCKGLILSTGETVLEGEASVLSRMLVLEIPPWEHRDPDGKYLLEADARRHYLPGFVAHFASWIAYQIEENDLQAEIARRFASNVKGYETTLKSMASRLASTGRVVKNWAVLITVYQLLSRFMREKDADDVLPTWKDTIAETVDIVREERASEVFLNVLGQLIASGEAVLAKDRQNPIEPPPGTVIVGYQDGEYIHLLPEVAYRAVNKVHTLKFTTAAIGAQLREDGWLVTTDGSRHLTVKVSVRGARVRMWRLKASTLNTDE